jgi:ABC-2 type transport system ATP-binding protein
LGEIFGFLGPNGAGKTTTNRLLLDLPHPTAETTWVLGFDNHRDCLVIHHHVGCLPGELPLIGRMRVRDQLDGLVRVRNLPDIRGARDLAERFDLDLNRRIEEPSKGNR